MLKAFVRNYLRPILHIFGLDLVWWNRDLFSNIKHFAGVKDLVIFDIGANEGQTIKSFKEEFPRSTIHSFEPSPATFEKLKKAACWKKVFIWNLALGSASGQATFLENDQPTMSSFLPLGKRGWGNIEKETMVNVTTVDQFCAEHKIERIDVLKSDTQGYDLEVFKGAEDMMNKGKIGMIYFEVNFSEMYQGSPPFEEIFDYLNRHDFQLQALYGINHNNHAIWTDALFVHKQYLVKK